MKTLHDVIAETKTTITEITSEGKKLWKVITSDGKELFGELGYKVFNPDWTCRGKQYVAAEKFKTITGIDVNNPDGHTECYHPENVFFPGDKVTIRSNLSTRDNIPFTVNEHMSALAGREATIISIRRRDRDKTHVNYKIDIDGGRWNWSCLAFEGCGFEGKEA